MQVRVLPSTPALYDWCADMHQDNRSANVATGSKGADNHTNQPPALNRNADPFSFP
jgi:hypothetical protein